MKPVFWVKFYFSIIFLSISGVVCGMYVYDPMMLFHKPILREVTLHSNMRQQAAGVIRNLDYDSYILGTSMLENTSADQATNLLGGRFANISMSGSDYFERKPALEFLLKKKAKQVIYSLDAVYLNQRKGHPQINYNSFYDLYETYLKGAYALYMQDKFLKCLFVLSSDSSCIGIKKTLDRPNAWIGSKSHNSRFGGLSNWFSAKNNNQIKGALASIVNSAKKAKKPSLGDYETNTTDAINYVNEYLINYALKHPETDFHLVFPPYSRIRYAQWHLTNVEHAAIHEAVIRYLGKVASNNKNIFVYGYEDQEFLDNIQNYKDTGHYDEWVNVMMLEDIKNMKNLITEDNVEAYILTSRKKAQNFDLIGLSKEIEDYLAEAHEQNHQ